MDMSVNSVSANSANYNEAYKSEVVAKQPENKEYAQEQAVVYEKTEAKSSSGSLYTINKMSAEEREALVDQLKQDMEARQQNLVNIVQSMMGKQAKTYSVANDEDAMWKFLASGDYTVDAATKEQAQKDIAEDGYWGVKKTSQRLFDFASALAGDDVEKMEKMQKAMEKGFKQAIGAWGKELPEICSETLEAANKLFEDYYASKQEQI